MKFLKFTYVDALTGISIASEPATNGPAFPPVAGLEYSWARESRYPTDVPEFFGTCPDESDTQIDGVLGVFSQGDWEGMRADEMLARKPPVPQEVTRAQGKAALIGAGLWQSTLDFIAAIPDAMDRALAEVSINDTQYWSRDSPFLNSAKDNLGLTDEQLNELFITASKIKL